jgi:hypothetical protein
MKLDLDEVMLTMLKQGSPIPLGFPHWALHEFVTRVDSPVDPAMLLGLIDNEDKSSMLDRYEDLKGYQFSWGTVAEKNYHYEEDPEDVRICTFEFSPEAVLKTFLQPDMLQDLFIFMYNHHPLRDERFDCDDAFGNLYTLAFSVTGSQAEHAELRKWMATTFIPLIWPDLNKEASLIVEEVKREALATSLDGTTNHALIEVRRNQLCPGPDEFTFLVI